ncbi:uncharacterized protein LOC109820809 [Asparagus officinalis]|uniref:uncharacterized protein LOC109820809 n=1 Tax=Asparagus officinalis TaxID=4686 RepID=UPI00098E5451|nr:uncharacterized protein LOC109820809 [Asparagus officinalis]
MVVARGNKTGTLYQTSHASDTLAIAADKESADLWHNRLGHMSEKGMKILHSEGKLIGIDSVEVGVCEDCIFRKQKREINKLKKQLAKEFAMKDLGAAKQIPGMRISRDAAEGTLKLS